jgi:hypothetical protein
VIRVLEVIGEPARKALAAAQTLHSEIPWREIKACGTVSSTATPTLISIMSGWCCVTTLPR